MTFSRQMTSDLSDNRQPNETCALADRDRRPEPRLLRNPTDQPNAEPETIQRVYRLLALRSHPDNQDSGNAGRFRLISEAYQVLSDPQRRAQYDGIHAPAAHGSLAPRHDGTECREQFRGRTDRPIDRARSAIHATTARPHAAGLFITELESLTGRPREHHEFTVWYLVQTRSARITPA
jgi:curved DNA-binding protein CbpA